MEIRENRDRGVTIVAPIGRVDSTTAGGLDERLTALIAAGERRLVVDFGAVEYISSAGLRVMLALAKKIRDTRGVLAICGLGDAVREVFSLAGFLPLFAVEPERASAVARIAGS